MEFASLTVIAEQMDKQMDLWRQPKTQAERGAFKAALQAQAALNEEIATELQRIREEFAYFKLHAISKMEPPKPPQRDPMASEDLKCISNPFRLYMLQK